MSPRALVQYPYAIGPESDRNLFGAVPVKIAEGLPETEVPRTERAGYRRSRGVSQPVFREIRERGDIG